MANLKKSILIPRVTSRVGSLSVRYMSEYTLSGGRNLSLLWRRRFLKLRKAPHFRCNGGGELPAGRCRRDFSRYRHRGGPRQAQTALCEDHSAQKRRPHLVRDVLDPRASVPRRGGATWSYFAPLVTFIMCYYYIFI